MSGSIVQLRIAQLTFWVGLTLTCAGALIPAPPAVPLVGRDQAQHFIAFYVLTVLAAAAFPRLKLIWIAIALSGSGAAIEIVQGLKIVSRDRDLWDWVADTLAIAVAFAPVVLISWTERFRASASHSAGFEYPGEGDQRPLKTSRPKGSSSGTAAKPRWPSPSSPPVVMPSRSSTLRNAE